MLNVFPFISLQMHQQSKGSAEKPKAVSYFNHMEKQIHHLTRIQYPDTSSQFPVNGSYAQKLP